MSFLLAIPTGILKIFQDPTPELLEMVLEGPARPLEVSGTGDLSALRNANAAAEGCHVNWLMTLFFRTHGAIGEHGMIYGRVTLISEEHKCAPMPLPKWALDSLHDLGPAAEAMEFAGPGMVAN